MRTKAAAPQQEAREHLVRRIMESLCGRQDKTLKYLQLAISHGLIPAPERWYGRNDSGFAALLQPGMHPMAFGDVYRVAVTRFEGSKTRRHLWNAVERFHEKLSRLRVASELWLAGSFLSTKLDPADVDGAVVLVPDRVSMLTPSAAMALDKLLDDAKRSKLDVALIFDGDLAARAYVQGLLGFCEDRRTTCGIAVVSFNGVNTTRASPQQLFLGDLS